MPKRFPPEFKRDVVRVVRRGDLTIAEVAADFDVSPESVRRWMHQADIDDGVRDGLTTAEQQTQLSLWAMARSPLIIGANLTLLDQDTLRLLCNTDILKIDQTATASRQVLHQGDLVIWTADLPGNQRALAAFNLGEKAIAFDRPLSDFFPAGPYDIKNAWTGARSPAGVGLSATLEPHASVVLMLDKK